MGHNLFLLYIISGKNDMIEDRNHMADHYRDRMEREVVPFLKKYRHSGFFCPDKGQKKIYYESYRREDAKGIVIMVHGFFESAEKYAEMIYYFFQAGYQVYIMDVRGHGRSAREQADLSLVHIDQFKRYLSNLDFPGEVRERTVFHEILEWIENQWEM